MWSGRDTIQGDNNYQSRDLELDQLNCRGLEDLFQRAQKVDRLVGCHEDE